MSTTISINSIKANPFQSRDKVDRDSIKILADEIRQQGYWGGAFTVRAANGHHELIHGHRRLEALKLLGWKEINVEVIKANDEEMRLLSLIENTQRENLTALEQGKSIKFFLDSRGALRNPQKLAETMGISVDTLHELRRLAELDAPTQKAAAKAGMSRTAITKADGLGGPGFIRAAAEHNLNRNDLDEIQTEVGRLSHPQRELIRKKLSEGKIVTPKQVRREIERLTTPPGSKIPPDIKEWLSQWQIDFSTRAPRIEQAAKFKKEIKEQYPKYLADFQHAWEQLSKAVNKLIT